MKRTSTRLLNIDDNALTSLLVLRFFAYLGHTVRFVDKLKQLSGIDQKFDLILINLACSFHEPWIAQCVRFIDREIPVISYAPEFLINDFNRAELSVFPKKVDEGWMLNSRLFQFIHTNESIIIWSSKI